MGKTTHDHHNDGQTDKSNGDMNPPHSLGDEMKGLVGAGSKSFSDMMEDNKAYKTGRDNVD